MSTVHLFVTNSSGAWEATIKPYISGSEIKIFGKSKQQVIDQAKNALVHKIPYYLKVVQVNI